MAVSERRTICGQTMLLVALLLALISQDCSRTEAFRVPSERTSKFPPTKAKEQYASSSTATTEYLESLSQTSDASVTTIPESRTTTQHSASSVLVQKYDSLFRASPVLEPVTWLGIDDVTDGHAVEGFRDGRALRAEGKEILVLVVSPVFQGKTPLQRQRMVNSLLSQDLASGVLHNVRMQCWTPQQWETKGKPSSFGG